MDIISKIEEIIGKSLSELTLDDIPTICKNEKFLKEMSNRVTALEIASEIIQTNRDKDVINEFIPIKITSEIYLAKLKITEIFKDYDVDSNREKLLERVKYIISNGKDHEVLTSTLVALSSLDELDISDCITTIKKATKSVENILYKISLEKALPVACELVDLIYSVRESYFSKYETDILDSTADLENRVSEINEYMKPIFELMQKEAEELTNGVPPEQLGLLDITKIKERGEENGL